MRWVERYQLPAPDWVGERAIDARGTVVAVSCALWMTLAHGSVNCHGSSGMRIWVHALKCQLRFNMGHGDSSGVAAAVTRSLLPVTASVP